MDVVDDVHGDAARGSGWRRALSLPAPEELTRDEVAMVDREPALPPEVLVHICVYCHEDKGSAKQADACEDEHQRTMSSADRQTRYAAYKRKFLRGFHIDDDDD